MRRDCSAPAAWRSPGSSRRTATGCGAGAHRDRRCPTAATARCSAGWPADSRAVVDTSATTSPTWRLRRRPTPCCGRRVRSSSWTSVRRRRMVVAVSPFGTTGPWADRPATELTLQAMSGAPGAARLARLATGDRRRPARRVHGRRVRRRRRAARACASGRSAGPAGWSTSARSSR